MTNEWIRSTAYRCGLAGPSVCSRGAGCRRRPVYTHCTSEDGVGVSCTTSSKCRNVMRGLISDACERARGPYLHPIGVEGGCVKVQGRLGRCDLGISHPSSFLRRHTEIHSDTKTNQENTPETRQKQIHDKRAKHHTSRWGQSVG